MPSVELPNTPKGWIITLAGAMVGFISGFVFLKFAEKNFR